MNISSNESVRRIFDRWKEEDGELKMLVNEIRAWMREIELFGIPHFGETATRIRSLRQRLVQHFSSEEEMILELIAVQPAQHRELDEFGQQSRDDHCELLTRLDVLMERLNQLEPPYDSWQDALEEFEQLAEEIDNHETQEMGNVLALMPAAADTELLD